MEVADWVVAGAMQASWSEWSNGAPPAAVPSTALPALASAPQIFIATPLTAFLPSRSPQTLAQHFLHCTSLLCLDRPATTELFAFPTSTGAPSSISTPDRFLNPNLSFLFPFLPPTSTVRRPQGSTSASFSVFRLIPFSLSSIRQNGRAHQKQAGRSPHRSVSFHSQRFPLMGYSSDYRNTLLTSLPFSTPQNTPLNTAPISSHAQQPGVASIKEGE